MGVQSFNLGINGFKIPKRLVILSFPKKQFYETSEGMPSYTQAGTRASALRGHLNNPDIAWPYLRNLLTLKKMYKKTLGQERVKRIDRFIEAANATTYSKLAGCTIDLRRSEARDAKKKKAWSESEWKKHMEYISQVAAPKKDFRPPPLPRGKSKPLEALMPRIFEISTLPEFKCYKTMSKEAWYRDPMKVSPSAMKYKISERTAKLAVAKVIPASD